MTDKDEKTMTASSTLTTAKARGTAARVVWLICLALALVLAVAAFSYALEANGDNSLVKLVRNLADTCDLGFFDLDNPIKGFEGEKNALTKTALTNYGIGAVLYIVLGRVLERVIRP